MSGNGEGVDSEVLKLQFQYALEHFKFHAQQRYTMFHFFLITFGLIVNAIVLLVTKGMFVPAGVVAIIGAGISLAFIFLQNRNAHLVYYGEHVLKYLEKEELFKGKKFEGVTLGFMLREALESDTLVEKAQRKYKHKLWMPGIQWAALVIFVAIAFVMFTSKGQVWLKEQIPARPAIGISGTTLQSGTPQERY